MLYLIQFYDEWIDFRIPEIAALLKLQGLNWNDLVREDVANPIDPTSTDPRHFYVVEFPNEDVIRAVCSRAILVKAVYELWSSGPSLAAAIEATHKISPQFLEPILGSEDSWAVHVNTFGRTLTMEQKQECRLNFKFLDFKGPVSVTAAKLEMWISLDYNVYRHSIAALAAASGATEANQLTLTDVPTYFGRLIAKGGMKEVVRIYDLKKRIYLGPTSLDDSLALILSNISGVTPGMLAYDPFVGTASILIALTHFGALCTGSDIDPRVLRGEMHAGTISEDEHDIKPTPDTTATVIDNTANTTNTASDSADVSTSSNTTSKRHLGVAEATAKKSKQNKAVAKKRNIFENFKAYGLPAPELIRMDNHLYDRHVALQHTANGRAAAGASVLSSPSLPEGYYDVIVTDPPYGIRAGAKKTGKNTPVTYTISEDRRHDHIPRTQKYPVEEVMLDLLHTAARSLVREGILTYILPTTYDFTENDLPVHPCLRLQVVCHQSLSSRHGRRAVVMQKYRDYSPELEAEYALYKETVMNGQDQGFGLLMGKLQAALDVDAFTNDAVVKNFSNCSSKRKASKDQRKQQREDGIFFAPKRELPVGQGGRRQSKKELKRQAVEGNSVSSSSTVSGVTGGEVAVSSEAL